MEAACHLVGISICLCAKLVANISDGTDAEQMNTQAHICTSNTLRHAAGAHTTCITHLTTSVTCLLVAMHMVYCDSHSLLFLDQLIAVNNLRQWYLGGPRFNLSD